MLWRCWLGGRKGIRPVKKLESWGTGMVICLKRDVDLHMAQLMPLPITVSCFSKIQIGFTFLVPAHPGSPGKRAVKQVCVWVCVWYHWLDDRKSIWRIKITLRKSTYYSRVGIFMYALSDYITCVAYSGVLCLCVGCGLEPCGLGCGLA